LFFVCFFSYLAFLLLSPLQARAYGIKLTRAVCVLFLLTALAFLALAALSSPQFAHYAARQLDDAPPPPPPHAEAVALPLAKAAAADGGPASVFSTPSRRASHSHSAGPDTGAGLSTAPAGASVGSAFTLAVALLSLCLGGAFTAMPLLAAALYPNDVPATLSWVQLATGATVALGTVLQRRMADDAGETWWRRGVGGYYLLCGAALACAAGMVLLLREPATVKRAVVCVEEEEAEEEDEPVFAVDVDAEAEDSDEVSDIEAEDHLVV
jgi:hypothetical protein